MSTDENIENYYSHDIKKLYEKLVEKSSLKEFSANEKETLELAKILLEWLGRYHRPKKISKTIEKLWISVSGKPNMLKKNSLLLPNQLKN